MQDVSTHFSEQLAAREADGRLRRLKTIAPHTGASVLIDGRPLVNFGSNDYLGLSTHPLLKERSIEYTQRYGVGATASRLLSGNLECYDLIERKLADLKGTETALIMPTGFQANLSVISCLLAGKAFAVLDRLSHNSLLEGAQLSKGQFRRYKHNDLNSLETVLSSSKSYDKTWIVTESVFSMDGDQCDLSAIAAKARQHNACLYVDEAHATGVLGRNGMGLTAGVPAVTVAMGTFGKACGSFGSYIACSHLMKQYLINFCSGVIYSTALPPPVLGAMDAALDLIPTMNKERQQLLATADHLRARLHELGYDTAGSSTQIIPVVIGTDNDAIALSKHLEEGGIYAPAIRPPTVQEGSARLRFSLTLHHTTEHIDRVITLMRNWHAR